MQTIAQTLGPEAILQYVNPTEAVKRLAAAQGIDTLNLIKSEQQLQQEMQQQMQMAQQQELVKQAGQFAGAPMMDPDKNPDVLEAGNQLAQGFIEQTQQPPE